MSKPIVPLLMIALMAATAAQAQFPGGGGGGGGGGGHGRGGHGGRPSGGSTTTTPTDSPSLPRAKPVNQTEIIGVVRAIDPASDRVTIAYEAVDARGWPAGTMPFVVSKTALLKDVTVGEKVRFRLESEQIAELKPF
jgi:Cu/Ag efflux protein CusF